MKMRVLRVLRWTVEVGMEMWTSEVSLFERRRRCYVIHGEVEVRE